MPFPKPSYRREKAAAKRRESKADRDVYAAVTERDCVCRSCGKANCRGIYHRHHIVYRSQGGATSMENVCLLCQPCHDAVHAGTLHLSGNADETLRIEWRMRRRNEQRGSKGHTQKDGG